ncbi:MAG: hypothetical protein V3V04_05320 [Rhizobiaceae bacterium]
MTKHKTQADKFRDTARELETDESVENFERNLKKIVSGDKPKPKDVKD